MICDLLCKQIIMSVLFIGERSPYYSPQLHQNQIITRNERKMRQEQYRLDLLHQMREKRERREKEKQAEAQYQREYQSYLKRGPAPTIFSTPKRNIDHNYHIASRIPRSATEVEEPPYRIPTSYKQQKTIFTPSTFDFPQLSTKRPPSRLKTQDTYDDSPFKQFTESYEKREQELREYEDKRFQQVYEKMYNSVDSLTNSQEQCELVRSRLKPIRLQLPTRPSRTLPNDPTHDKYYRLPPIARVSRSRQREEHSNWREWYAREKLRELQEYYRKALIDDQTRERQQNDGSRAGTPSFPYRVS